MKFLFDLMLVFLIKILKKKSSCTLHDMTYIIQTYKTSQKQIENNASTMNTSHILKNNIKLYNHITVCFQEILPLSKKHCLQENHSFLEVFTFPYR